MSRANEADKRKSNAFPIFGGIVFILIGVAMLGFSVYSMTSYDKVEGELDVYQHWGSKGKVVKASITYEYNDVVYEGIVLDSYNAFTMKDGKPYTVYINPARPDYPVATNFALGTLVVLAGGACFVPGIKPKEKNK